MQPNAHLPQAVDALGEDAVVEDHERVTDDRPGLPQGVAEGDLAAAFAGQILDEKHALPLTELTFDLSHPPEPLGFLADINHGQPHPFGDPCGKRNAGRLPSGDRVDRLVADLLTDDLDGHVHDLGAGARVADQLADIDVDGAAAAGREGEGFVRIRQDGPDFQQDTRRRVGDAPSILRYVSHAICSSCRNARCTLPCPPGKARTGAVVPLKPDRKCIGASAISSRSRRRRTRGRSRL